MSDNKKVRHVWGRVRNQEVGDKYLYHFELVKSKLLKPELNIVEGGVIVRRKGARKSELITFSKLAEGACVTKDIAGRATQFTLNGEGLVVRVKGERASKLIPYAALQNLGLTQPTLFR